MLNSKNEYRYESLLNGTLKEKIETLKQIHTNEKRSKEDQMNAPVIQFL